MNDYTPSEDDRFSFGVWTLGWLGVDVPGPAARRPLEPMEAVNKLSELGAAAVTFRGDESARACMRNHLILRDKVNAFRADPAVQAALEAAKVSELREPTLDPREDLTALRDESIDIETLGARSVGLEALDQLAMEHLLGVR